MSVHCELDGDIGVVTIDNPPVNALAPGVREAIMEAVAHWSTDERVTAFVLIGAGQHFIAGADIRQFGKERSVSTRDSAAAIERSTKPVVAALQGLALGGGFEHALACHYRVASPTARLGFPEVTLGLIPGGGGTQRLTAMVGPEAAISIITSSGRLSAEQALELGLVDEILRDDDFRKAAIRYARRVSSARPLPRACERLSSLGHDPKVFEEARRLHQRNSTYVKAAQYAINCVETAVSRPFEEGMQLEQRLFAELESSEESKALRYAFFAEREAAKVPGTDPAAKVPEIRTAAIIGAGTMGGGIAMSFADAGLPVKVLEVSSEALQKGMHRIQETYATRVKRGSLTQEEMDRRMARIKPVEQYAEIAECDAAIEAVFERLDIKESVFSQLDATMKPGALLLTNSSAIDIDLIAASTRRPSDVAGAHFFAPANVMKLCEVVQGRQTAPETVLRAMRMGKSIGKVPVVAGSCDGFVANRSRTPMMTETMLMLEEGALPEQIDGVMVAFGYPKGPFAVNDISGLDISYASRKRRAEADPEYRKLHVPDRLVEMGRLGQKTGAGWYRYEPGARTPISDGIVKEVISAVAREHGIAQRTFTDAEILHRLLFASVNEVCKILEEGKAYRASDVDVMWLYGFGFPRHRGGLMYWADTIGASEIYRQVVDWHQRYGRRWQPSNLLQKVAQSGGQLRDARSDTAANQQMRSS